MIHLDTHVALWLFDGRLDKLSPTARSLLRASSRPMVSPMVRLELTFLHEIGRTRYPAVEILDALRVEIDLGAAEASFERVAAIASTVSWTRDPFDRMIVAHALADDLPLLTIDSRICENTAIARWD